jgi:predicted nucleic acid-binding protein
VIFGDQVDGDALRLLVDTNVWLDYYLDRGSLHDEAKAFVTAASSGNVVLYTAASSLKDVYFLITSTLKRMERAEGRAVDDAFAASASEVAWACVFNLCDLSLIVPLNTGSVWGARMVRSAHEDFEDDLLVACGQSAHVEYLVTSDEALARHSPIPAVGIVRAREIVLARKGLFHSG